jgi:tripartite-type tricarboxylate transporter receptor subunit TctC
MHSYPATASFSETQEHFKTMDHTTNRRQVLKSLMAASIAASPAFAFAKSDWPKKSIRLVVPFAPGGTSSIIARTVGQELNQILGVSVIIDNKGGGGGVPAMLDVAKSPADGYTFIVGHIGSLAVNPFIYPNSGYNVNRDFSAVTLLTMVPNMFVVHKDVPANNFKEFVAYVKSRPGKVNYASAGIASAGHLSVESLKHTVGLQMDHIPYRGTGPALADVLAGRIEFFSAGTPALMPHIRSGALRVLAVGTTKRISILPDTPTVQELGYPGFETSQWYGINAPAKVPADILSAFRDACVKALNASTVQTRLAHDSAQAVGNTPQEYADFILAEQKRWKVVVDAAKITAG